MINRATIQAMRDKRAAELANGRAMYDRAELELKELDRQLCTLYGALELLDQLLLLCRFESDDDTIAESNGRQA